MFSPSPSQSSNFQFNEVAIADFGPFQIAVLTASNLVKRKLFSGSITTNERIYQQQGWLLNGQQIIGHLEALSIGSVFSDNDPFDPIQRIAPSIALSFEVQGSAPLPSTISKYATFACEIKDSVLPFHTVFRNIAPHFVQLYPFRRPEELVKQAKKMLITEARFVQEHREQLKQVSFFRRRLGL